jgi:DNA-directed RNA polymerase sigma subunit (sigma70/sigma32)
LVGFLPCLKKVSDLLNDGIYKDNMEALQGMVKAHMHIIIKLALKYELGISLI